MLKRQTSVTTSWQNNFHVGVRNPGSMATVRRAKARFPLQQYGSET